MGWGLPLFPRLFARRKRLARLALAAAVVAAPVAALHGYARLLPPVDLAKVNERSAVVVDRYGLLLRPFVMADGRWRMPVSAKDVDPRFLSMLIAYEDRRFRAHGGVDPLAIARSLWQMVWHGRVISGGSTLSMQVARLIEPRTERSLGAKFRQAARAIALEKQFGKDGVLDLYLSLAPYGGNLEGVRAASLAYFGREPARLGTAEAALLVALPQAPETRRPDRFPKAAAAARDQVLARIAALSLVPAEDLVLHQSETLPEARKPFPAHAPHRAEHFLAVTPQARRVETHLDRGWQVALERLAQERAEALGPALSVAILVVEHTTGRVRASVGGADYFNASRHGGIDLTRALRSPGSALKPFIYGFAFDEGLAHPETMLEDRPLRFGTWAPDNFDSGFQGMVSARHALQHSLNLPAVDLLARVGAQSFLSRLRQTGAKIILPKDSAAGLALGLGGLGISLDDLTALFAAIARGGETVALAERADLPTTGSPVRLMSDVAAWYLADILREAPPPDNGPSGRIAFKTGTSYGYRDAWAVGFDRHHTIGVWVGRADNGAVSGLIGRKAAAPILFDAFQRIGLQPGLPPRPKGVLEARSARLPPPLRHIRTDIPKTIGAMAQTSPQIAFPPDGSAIDMRATLVDGRPYVSVKVQGGMPPFTYLVNGAPLGDSQLRRETGFHPESAGFLQISVIDARGQTDRVDIRMQ